jgi:hypothetical protein
MTTRKIFGLVDALNSIKFAASWSIDGPETYNNLIWFDTELVCPTEEEVSAEIAKLQAEYDAEFYRLVRAEQYPSIGDQLDMLWHAMEADPAQRLEPFYTSIKAVKDQNPKA